MTTGFEFEVPATTAHLGPGFGVLGLALDLRFRVTVQPSDFEGIVIERPSDAAGATLDVRHNAILRGLHAARERWKVKLPKGLTIVIDGDVPRGCGLGSNSADFAAGVGTALRFAKPPHPDSSALLDLMVELGSDPGHGAAALDGGLVIAVHARSDSQGTKFRVLAHPIAESWRLVIVAPRIATGTADAHRVVPASLPHGVVSRTSGRLAGLLRSLATADEELLGICLADESHVPFRLGTAPGIRQAIRYATEAGAAGATISGHGPAVVALTTDETRCDAIRTALQAAFAEVGVETGTRTCHASDIGAIQGNHSTTGS